MPIRLAEIVSRARQLTGHLERAAHPDPETAVSWIQDGLIQLQRQTDFYSRRVTMAFPAASNSVSFLTNAGRYMETVKLLSVEVGNYPQVIIDMDHMLELRQTDAIGTSDEETRYFALNYAPTDVVYGTIYLETIPQFISETNVICYYRAPLVLPTDDLQQTIDAPVQPLVFYLAWQLALSAEDSNPEYFRSAFEGECNSIRRCGRMVHNKQNSRNVGFLAQQAAGGRRRWDGKSN